jgi:hypothetical protein
MCTGVTKLMGIRDAMARCPELVLVSGEDLGPYRQVRQRAGWCGMDQRSHAWRVGQRAQTGGQRGDGSSFARPHIRWRFATRCSLEPSVRSLPISDTPMSPRVSLPIPRSLGSTHSLPFRGLVYRYQPLAGSRGSGPKAFNRQPPHGTPRGCAPSPRRRASPSTPSSRGTVLRRSWEWTRRSWT